MKNSKLLAAAAAALASAPGANAIAADAVATDDSLNLSIEGGLVVSDFSKSSDFSGFGSKLGEVEDADYDLGGYGAISIGKNFQDSPFDWKLSGSITEFMTNERNSYYNYGEYTLSETDDFDFQAVDFDLGNNFGDENVKGRVFAGIRALHSTDSATADQGVYYDIYSLDFEVGGEFLGVGPRVGLDMRVGGTVGLVGSVAAAAVFGRQTNDASISYDFLGLDYAEVNDTETDWDWVTDVSASAGISVRPSSDTELVVGYRVEQLTGTREASSDLTRDEDVLQHGPTLKLNVKF